MQHLLELLGFGIVDASVLAVAAIAFTLQFGVTNYFNFGYGEWITFGAYMAWTFNAGALHLNIWLALAVAAVAGAVMSLVVNRVVLAPFARHRPEPLYMLIVTFAVGAIMSNIYIAVWGTRYHQLSYAATTPRPFGPFLLTSDQVTFFAIALGLMAATHLLLRGTKLGRCMRAMADDKVLANVCGIPTERITDATWLLTGLMAAVAGVILAMATTTFNTALGDTYVYLVFPAVIIGGIGRVYGALVGGMIIGLATVVGALVIPASISPLLVFAALVAIILFRPQGLLGAPTHGRMGEG